MVPRARDGKTISLYGQGNERVNANVVRLQIVVDRIVLGFRCSIFRAVLVATFRRKGLRK